MFKKQTLKRAKLSGLRRPLGAQGPLSRSPNPAQDPEEAAGFFEAILRTARNCAAVTG